MFAHQQTQYPNRNNQKKISFFQPKLTINQPSDEYEQEADAMADKLMRMPVNGQPFFKPVPLSVSPLQRKCKDCEEELHRKENSLQATEADNDISSYVNSLSSKGSLLPESERQFFEPRLGHDFSHVKIHTDSEAVKSSQSVNALAYTTGNHIVFNQNQFSPGSDAGKKLLAHELTHVVQQSKGTTMGSVMRSTSFNGQQAEDVNPADRFIQAVKNGPNASFIGITNIFINGKDITSIPGNINPLNLPAATDVAATQKKGQWESSVKNVPGNAMSYIMHIPKVPSGNVWSVPVTASDISSITSCQGQLDIYIKGKPSNGDVVTHVKTHESQHVTDWQGIYNGTLISFDRVLNTTKATDSTEQGSISKLIHNIQSAAGTIYRSIADQFTQRAATLHSSASGGKANFNITGKDPSCMWIKADLTT